MQTFYLGTHQEHWLRSPRIPEDVALFVSHRRFINRETGQLRRTLPVARVKEWAMDSGGFTEIQKHGRWTISPADYVANVRRIDTEVGGLSWAAPQDWMCEPAVINGGVFNGQTFVGTHLSVIEHQSRTVANFVELQALWGDAETCPFMPVLQGWQRDDYLRCMDMYAAAGVDLTRYPVVGLGSVCRRQATNEIGDIVSALLAVDQGLPLHGFGVKSAGLEKYGHLLNTADSMAWSFTARRLQRPALPECVEAGRHINCANCIPYALRWRDNVLAALTPARAAA